MPSLLPGHYAAVKVRKELYVTLGHAPRAAPSASAASHKTRGEKDATTVAARTSRPATHNAVGANLYLVWSRLLRAGTAAKRGEKRHLRHKRHDRNAARTRDRTRNGTHELAHLKPHPQHHGRDQHASVSPTRASIGSCPCELMLPPCAGIARGRNGPVAVPRTPRSPQAFPPWSKSGPSRS